VYLHRYVFCFIKPKHVEEFEMEKAELGLLDSGFSLFYSLGQIPMGVAVDTMGVHAMLTGMILLWSIGLWLHAWAPTPGSLWYGRAVLGAGQSGVFAALSRASRSWFPATTRTTAQGWIGVFFGRGGGVTANLVIGTVVLGILNVPWRTAIYWLTLLGIGHAIAFVVLYRNSPSKHRRVNRAEVDVIQEGEDVEAGARPKLSIREMFSRMTPRTIRNLFSLNVQMILSNIADNIFSAWIPLFLFEVHHLEFKLMGIYATLPLLGGAIGGAFGGWLNDFMIRRTGNRRWSRSGVGLAGKGMAGLLLLTAMLWYDDPYKFCTMLFFVKFFSDWSLSTTWGAVTDIGGPATATVFAFNNAVGTIGAIMAPSMYGAIAQYGDWKYVFLTGAATYLVCALSWLFFNSTISVIEEEG